MLLLNILSVINTYIYVTTEKNYKTLKRILYLVTIILIPHVKFAKCITVPLNLMSTHIHLYLFN